MTFIYVMGLSFGSFILCTWIMYKKTGEKLFRSILVGFIVFCAVFIISLRTSEKFYSSSSEKISDKDLFDQYYIAKIAKAKEFDDTYEVIISYIKNEDYIGALAEAKSSEMKLFKLSESLRKITPPELGDATLSKNLKEGDEVFDNTYTLKWQVVSKLLDWSKDPSLYKVAGMRKDSDLASQGIIYSMLLIVDVGMKVGSTQIKINDKK